MKRFSLFLSSLLCAANAWSSVCENSNCKKGFKETSICFVDPDVGETWDPLWVASVAGACGYMTDKYIIKTEEDFAKAFAEVAQSCQKIKTLRFFGHGAPGYHGAGRINPNNVPSLAQYNCTMALNAHIDFSGCNTGRGCVGQFMMYSLAEALLPHAGTVSAPSFYSSTFLPGIIPHHSLNGSSRTLSFDPKRQPPDKWGYSGFAFGPGKTLAKECTRESVDELMKQYETARKQADDMKTCEQTDFDKEILEKVRRARAEVRTLSSKKFISQIRQRTEFWDLYPLISRTQDCVRRQSERGPAERASDQNVKK